MGISDTKANISWPRRVLRMLNPLRKGLRLSLRHLFAARKRQQPLGIPDPEYFQQDQGLVTIHYPKEQVPVPDTGRYRLHMETEDCIACDKCARICPVDCITIESFRADGDLGRTSDGTIKRLHLPVFDIDMGKCMYCGLCTTVCPTECLTMTKVYDFSEYDRDNFVYHFGGLDPIEELKVREETEKALAEKKAAKAAARAAGDGTGGGQVVKKRPVVKRRPVVKSEDSGEGEKGKDGGADGGVKKPVKRARPMMKRKASSAAGTDEKAADTVGTAAGPKAADADGKVGGSVMAEGSTKSEGSTMDAGGQDAEKPKKRPRPVMKRKASSAAGTDEKAADTGGTAAGPKAADADGKVGGSVMAEGSTKSEGSTMDVGGQDAEKPKKRPRPVMKRKASSAAGMDEKAADTGGTAAAPKVADADEISAAGKTHDGRSADGKAKDGKSSEELAKDENKSEQEDQP